LISHFTFFKKVNACLPSWPILHFTCKWFSLLP
jgi:hypothetical protein